MDLMCVMSLNFMRPHARSCGLVVVSPGMCRRRHFLETFVEEATLMSRLHHPNLQTLVGQ
jgi:hypothetical protein